jgi:hypothetical protein
MSDARPAPPPLSRANDPPVTALTCKSENIEHHPMRM